MYLEEWARNRRELERRKTLRKRRRNRQIFRRLAMGVVSIGLVLTVLAKIGSGGKEKEQLWDIPKVKTEYENTGTVLAASASGNEKREPQDVCIVLDAGHGGKDPGTLWKDIYEKDINLAITKKLEQLLESEGYRVIMTRNGDTKLELEERVRIAEENQADLFVSIHQNALENDNVTTGIEIYCNESSNSESGELADAIHTCLLDETGAVDKGITKDSDFFVVQNSTVPACLIETGFLTAEKEREKLLDENYQMQAAQGIAEGIRRFVVNFLLEDTQAI